MQTYLKTRPGWIQLLLFIGMAFGILVIFTFIGALILSKMTGIDILALQDISKWDANNPNLINYLRGMILVQFLGLFLVPSLLFGYFSDPKPMDYLGLKGPSKASYWLLGAITLLVALPLVEAMGVLNQKLAFGNAQDWVKRMEEEATKQIQFMLGKHTLKELFTNLFFIAILAGIGEELFFRGVLQRIIIKMTKSPWAGIIITAAVFSAFHFQFFGFIPRFILGILLGAIYWYSGSLWTAIIGHIIHNGFAIVLIYLNPELIKKADATIIEPTGVSMILYASISLLLTILLVWQMKKSSVMTMEKVYQDDQPPKNDFSF